MLLYTKHDEPIVCWLVRPRTNRLQLRVSMTVNESVLKIAHRPRPICWVCVDAFINWNIVIFESNENKGRGVYPKGGWKSNLPHF